MIERLLKEIARSLDREKIPYMVIGGQAVLLYGTPRLTRDIDLTLGIDTDQFSFVQKICKRLKLKSLPKEPERFVKQTKVFPTEETQSRIRVDFIFSFTPYERQAMKRVRRVRIRSYPVKYAAPEDVIIHKIFASRPVDLEDVRNILLKLKTDLNILYMRKWLSKFEKPERKKFLGSLNALLKE